MAKELNTNEEALRELAATVTSPDPVALERAWARLDSLTKPPRSLGKLEEIAARLAQIQRTDRPSAKPAAIVTMAGDHGVVAQGVSAWPSEVTMQMVANIAAGGAAVNQLAKSVGAEVVVVDVGTAGDTSVMPGVVQAKVRPGTADMSVEPAMTREEAAAAVLAGAGIAGELAARGVRVIGTGEMGIGNTTPASALTSALTGAPVAEVVGRGTGVGDEALRRKIQVIERALALHAPDVADPLGVLAAVGGLEIAGMAGVVLGGAAAGVAVVADGFISTVAALVAVRICPAAWDYVFASHRSLEPGHRAALAALGREPFIELDMRLGEGTGSAVALGIMDGACAVMSGMATFAEAGVSDRVD